MKGHDRSRPPSVSSGRGLSTVCTASMLAFLLCGCGSVVESPTPIGSPRYEAARPPEPYRILAGDELEIRFFHTPELNATLPVRPDGYISLPYAREVRAAGRTPDEVAQELMIRYGEELRDPEIAVIVQSFSASRIHVGGRVKKPGVFPLQGGMTVLQSVFEAGGLESSARLSEVLVIRRTPDRSYIVIPVDLEAVLDGTDVSQNIALMPFDAVYVPDSPIGNVNTWIDLYIRQNIPINFGIRPEVAAF